MKSIWLVVAEDGGHNPGSPVRAFADRSEADRWAASEQVRVDAVVRVGGRVPDEWYGRTLSVEEVPFGSG